MQRFPPSTLHAVVLAFIFSACSLLEPTSPDSSNPDSVPVEDAWLQVAPSLGTLNAIGDTLRLSASVVAGGDVRPPQGAVVWQTLDPSVASVNVLGEVVALAVGVARISASCDCALANDTATVNVRQILASVTVRPEGATLTPQGSEQLTATAADSNGVAIGGLTLTWQSSNPTVVSVSQGQVTAEAAGAALITAFIEDRVGWSAVTVSPRSVATVSVEPAQATIAFGDTIRLNATAYDSTGALMEGASFGWSSADSLVVSVMAGLAKGRAAGTTVVTAKAGGKTGSSTITVLPPPVNSIAVTPSQSTLNIGGAVRLNAVAYDVNGRVIEGASFTWNSSASDVARVTDGLVEALAAGSATITASTAGVSGSASVTVQVQPPPPPPPPSGAIAAFPGAEGYGALALNNCDRSNVEVIRVTNLNNGGSGSLRDAIGRADPARLSIITFQTGGTITLTGSIDIQTSCLYIAGQTAPGGGIQLRGPGGGSTMRSPLLMDAHGLANDIVLRYLRVRLGKQPDHKGSNIPINGGSNIIIDHVSTAFSNDENISIFKIPDGPATTNITVQWSMVTTAFTGHSVGLLIGTAHDLAPTNISVHHNAFIHVSHRLPRLRRIFPVEIINNVVYNWVGRITFISDSATADYIGNYWKQGPMTPSNPSILGVQIVTAEGWTEDPTLYLEGNVWDPGQMDPHADQRNFVRYYGDKSGPLPAGVFVSTPQTSPAIPVQVSPASIAYDAVMANAGASQRVNCRGDWVPARDQLDARFVEHVTSGGGPSTSAENDHEDDYGGYPALQTGTPCADSDGDGMPDEFESRYGFDQHDASDASGDANGDGYTNIEEYVNGRNPR